MIADAFSMKDVVQYRGRDAPAACDSRQLRCNRRQYFRQPLSARCDQGRRGGASAAMVGARSAIIAPATQGSIRNDVAEFAGAMARTARVEQAAHPYAERTYRPRKVLTA